MIKCLSNSFERKGYLQNYTSIMGLFSFFRSKNKKVEIQTIEQDRKEKVLLAMPIFINGGSLKLDKVVENLKGFWGLNVSNIEGDNETAAFEIDGLTIALGNMPIPIPKEELDEVIPYAYVWRDAAKELEKHTGHAIVSILGGEKTQIERFTILSKLLCSILITSENCIAIYQGNETLLLHKDHYLSAVDDLKMNRIPISAWIYIGLRSTASGIDAYTYGLFNFGKPEIEIIDSGLDTNRLYTMILSIATHIIDKDITFRDEDIYSLSGGVKLKVNISKGIYVDGVSLKFTI
ncbi:DUF4261 domain-containing protein [Dysgonomonas sp. GY617]|uniref:DUF4261 domain-containing protein n=1 Tax=Dysgonomonas sp. GY617 TaxID=2780420 RepID=UPI001883E117|nr:DUF4261 domain-containing protein [Dysgonomonas sp. GY617]MBF0575324.1 DUF4261 domain-containing protein [Dysgonomonas sp. GY617]